MLASYTMAPCEGHMQAMFHIFAFLNTHQRSMLVLDPSYIEHGVEDAPDWQPFYLDAREEMPPNSPPPLGNAIQITAFIDSDHAGDILTQWSRLGVLIYLNRSPNILYSKKQNSVETSTFGSDFSAFKNRH